MLWVQYKSMTIKQILSTFVSTVKRPSSVHQMGKLFVLSCCNVYLFFRSLLWMACNLAISIHRINSFHPGVPRKNSLKSSKPRLLPWLQAPWQQISIMFSWSVPLLPTSQFFLNQSVFSSSPLPLSPSWTLSFFPSNLSLQTLPSQYLSVQAQSVWSPDLLK